MPASKPDLETANGRLQYARIQAGYEQEEFAKLMGYESASGWAKIETGQNDLKFEHIEEANKVLKLDVRYYFGELNYEEARLGKARTIEDLANRFEKLERAYSPREKLDPVAERVMARAELYDLVQTVQFWDGLMINQFRDWAMAYSKGRQDENEVHSTIPDKKEKIS